MPKSSNDEPQQIVHLGIALDDVVPEVSRIVAVPLGIHLDMLHLVLQAAMGWSNTHRWLIEAGDCTWGVPDPDSGGDIQPADRTTLIDLVADTGVNRFDYIYDFRDQWEHSVNIVKPMSAAPGVTYPLLIDAAGRCPLEDSGGPRGYADLLEALLDPTHPRRAEVAEWPGLEFDPTEVNRLGLERAVGNLAKLMTPRSGRRATRRPPTRRGKSKGDEWF
jgi:Plasmid pRiA4b ORF-3-like protein